MRKIITEHVMPPVQFRDMDWSAVFEGYEPDDWIGWGASEGEAIRALLELSAADSQNQLADDA